MNYPKKKCQYGLSLLIEREEWFLQNSMWAESWWRKSSVSHLLMEMQRATFVIVYFDIMVTMDGWDLSGWGITWGLRLRSKG